MNLAFFRLTMLSCNLMFFTTIVFFSATGYAKSSYLRVGKTTDIPSVGIKMKMPKDASAKPLGSISVKTLTQKRGNQTRKIEAYFPEDLWMRDQLAGRWGNEDCMISVYNMNLPPPVNLKALFRQGNQAFVSKETYDAWKEDEKGKWKDENVLDWLCYLTGSKLKLETEPLKKETPKSAVTYFYELKDSRGPNLIYVISPEKYPDKHFAVQFSIPGSLDDKSKKTIGQCLASMTFYPTKGIDLDDKKMTTGKKTTTQKKDWSPEYIASRERVINNIKNLKDWWYLETDNFIIVADIKNKKTVRELQEGLEKSRDVFAKIYPIEEPLKAISVAKAFASRQGYKDYLAGTGFEDSAGLWMSDRKELVVSPMDWGSVKDRRKMMVEVIQHEGFHQYIYFATGGQHAATWFNEGNATFFSGIEFKGKKPVIEETYRLEKAKQLAASADIQGLINMSQEEYYRNKDRNYALGYALIFFLHKGAPVIKKKNNYSEIPTKYYEALIKIKNPDKATEIAWEGIDMKEFTDEFHKFWSDKSMIKKALRYDIIKAKELEFAKKLSK